jgi:hypothetical protein
MAGILDQTGIENFYDVASQNDFTRKNLFRIVSLGGQRFTLNELLYMTTAKLPGRQIENVTVPFMGLTFNTPGNASYPGSDNWTVQFRIPQNLSIRRKLEDWSRFVFDDQTSTGEYNLPNKNVENQTIITLIDKQGNPLRTYTLFGCYCKSIGEFDLDITTKGEIVTTDAVLAYQYWRLSR